MATKTTEKKETKKAAKSGGSKTTAKATTEKTPTATKATTPPTPADGDPAGNTTPTEPAPPAAPRDEAQPEPDDSAEVCVFAFRLSRAERYIIHEAAGPAKASRFVKAVALAAARRDTTALQTAIQEAEANRASK